MRRCAAALVVVLGLVAVAAPARAAEAGGARLLAAPSAGTGSGSVHGSCRTWSSSAGEYGAVCSGGGRAKDYRALLDGAAPPTCWLVPPGSTDFTPKGAAPPAEASTLSVAVPAPTLTARPAPGSTATPTTTPTGTPTATPTAAPTATPPSVPTSAPAIPSAPVPAPGTPSSTTTEVPAPTPTETVPVERPQDFLQVCVTSAPDPVTLAPARPTTFEAVLVPVLLSDPGRLRFWWELTEGQRQYLTFVDDRSRVDEGRIVTSPSRTPRIGQVVAFSATGTSHRPLAIGRLRMDAELVSLRVRTGEPGRPDVTCAGPGRELPAGATERTGPDVCSFSYRETSAGRGTAAPDTYDVTATETWRIRVSSDAGATWTTERVVEIPVPAGLRVTEVQTLVVPLVP
ncbi:hypothetical protein FHR75_003572 [Kineococcus radiotolerans]|uniref:Uncharacterized protein n=1 Tax=Kineococcus radiotolerans TaxID=131568 RepID=A0A7W4TPJ3_KINRA|nr:hypothetical protein [Kineococcus radiotolerans]MBB2902736.1 hypothetical protein [Kineococcus radiotolerans]